MRSNSGICSLFLALAVTVVAAPAAAHLDFEVVGFSQAQLAGDAGLLAMDQACQTDFTGSPVCTSREYLLSTSLPTRRSQTQRAASLHLAGSRSSQTFEQASTNDLGG